MRGGVLLGFSVADIVKISVDELLFLFPEAADESEAIHRLLSEYPNLRLIAVTEGALGSRGYTRRGDFADAPGYSVNFMDATGAGDAYMAGLLCFLLRQGSDLNATLSDFGPHLADALRYANACGAIATTTLGATAQGLTEAAVAEFSEDNRMITLDLSGKNALVTGGTRGIGRAISRRLAEAGANTLAVWRGDEGTAQKSLTERQAFGTGTHRNHRADIGEEGQIDELIAQVKADFSEGLDILVLNAGIGLGGEVTEIDPKEWRRMLDVNLGSAFLLTRGLVPVMRRGGSIVAIGSGSGHDPLPGLAFYGAAKAGLNMFIADLAQEVGPDGIRANVVSPGGTDTSYQGNAPSPTQKQDSATHNALRRRGVPDDVAGVVLFLCSDLAGFVTGQAIRVNGAAL